MGGSDGARDSAAQSRCSPVLRAALRLRSAHPPGVWTVLGAMTVGVMAKKVK